MGRDCSQKEVEGKDSNCLQKDQCIASSPRIIVEKFACSESIISLWNQMPMEDFEWLVTKYSCKTSHQRYNWNLIVISSLTSAQKVSHILKTREVPPDFLISYIIYNHSSDANVAECYCKEWVISLIISAGVNESAVAAGTTIWDVACNECAEYITNAINSRDAR